ncbi:glycosyl transferase group 1 [Desulfovibrio sp. X2]|uniref:glycosyltransferase n=1 Tax=Desulfovibrio sp. X2 TaxID=941449 RepID=UPI000358E8B5|nr:glycosyltransferase [Desulfovibrio sp. X2]EPR44222.1 glycosyl transferase group 1 [Desulfovibrio sp. X2]
MNVLFVNSTRRWGGVKTWTLDLAARLAAAGHGAHVACRPGPFADKARSLGLPVEARRFGLDYSPAMILWFLRLFKAWKTDVVVCNVGKDLRTAGVAARLAGLPVVHRVGLPRDMRDTLKVRLTHRFVRPRLLSPCEYIKDEMLDEVSFLRPDEITVIRTGKPCAGALPAAAQAPGVPRRLVMTSQLNADKGHADVLRALARLAAEGLDFRLDVVGEGREAEALRALADALGIAEKLTFLGFQASVQPFLAQAEIFVLASRSEGLPNTLLEAMAAGLAPIARNVGGVAEVWPEELSPFLTTPAPAAQSDADENDLTQPLRTLLSVPDEELARLRGAALAACRERFEIGAQAARLTDWLAGLAATRQNRPRSRA